MKSGRTYKNALDYIVSIYFILKLQKGKEIKGYQNETWI